MMKLFIAVTWTAALLAACKDKQASKASDKPTGLEERDNPQERIRDLKAACAAKEPGTCAELTMEGIDRDRAGTLAKLAALCDARDGHACDALASAYENQPDGHTSGEIVGLYDKACTLDELHSCHVLGDVFLRGQLGMPKDMAKARAALQRGCDLGDQPMCEQVKTVPAN